MKISHETDMSDELRPEYDLSLLSNRVRGRYAHLEAATPTVTLDPDVAAVFADDAAVNEALRYVIQLANENPLTVRRTRIAI